MNPNPKTVHVPSDVTLEELLKNPLKFPVGTIFIPEVIPCQFIPAPVVDRLQPRERLERIAAECYHHEPFRRGLSRVILPNATGEPSGEPIAVSSPCFKQWLSRRYLVIYGEPAPSGELKSFVSRFDFQLRMGPKGTQKRAK